MSDPYGHRAVWRIATPMIVSSVTVPMLGMVDTAVMGHLEYPWYLGAVAAGATIFSVLFMGFNFLRMGTTGITAQCFGAGDYDRIRDGLGQSLSIALVLSALILLVREPLIDMARTALNVHGAMTAGVLTNRFLKDLPYDAPAPDTGGEPRPVPVE